MPARSLCRSGNRLEEASYSGRAQKAPAWRKRQVPIDLIHALTASKLCSPAASTARSLLPARARKVGCSSLWPNSTRKPRCPRSAGPAAVGLAGQGDMADRLKASLAGLRVALLRAGRVAPVVLAGPAGRRDHVTRVHHPSRLLRSKWDWFGAGLTRARYRPFATRSPSTLPLLKISASAIWRRGSTSCRESRRKMTTTTD